MWWPFDYLFDKSIDVFYADLSNSMKTAYNTVKFDYQSLTKKTKLYNNIDKGRFIANFNAQYPDFTITKITIKRKGENCSQDGQPNRTYHLQFTVFFRHIEDEF